LVFNNKYLINNKKNKMKIIINGEEYLKLKNYINYVDYEISGIGKSSIIDGIIYIEEICVFDQECSYGNTILNEDTLAKFFSDKVKQGESVKNWNVWWHSHGNMDAFFSSTDNENIKKMGRLADYIISIVLNRKYNIQGRVDIFNPQFGRIDIDEILISETAEERKIRFKCNKELKNIKLINNNIRK